MPSNCLCSSQSIGSGTIRLSLVADNSTGYEESGLRVRLLRHLVDVRRSQTYTRYYLAERVGGSPADMGWESQCVMLVPLSKLNGLRLKAPDLAVIQALGTC